MGEDQEVLVLIRPRYKRRFMLVTSRSVALLSALMIASILFLIRTACCGSPVSPSDTILSRKAAATAQAACLVC